VTGLDTSRAEVQGLQEAAAGGGARTRQLPPTLTNWRAGGAGRALHGGARLAILCQLVAPAMAARVWRHSRPQPCTRHSRFPASLLLSVRFRRLTSTPTWCLLLFRPTATPPSALAEPAKPAVAVCGNSQLSSKLTSP
jgi:hypothetical protein